MVEKKFDLQELTWKSVLEFQMWLDDQVLKMGLTPAFTEIAICTNHVQGYRSHYNEYEHSERCDFSAELVLTGWIPKTESQLLVEIARAELNDKLAAETKTKQAAKKFKQLERQKLKLSQKETEERELLEKLKMKYESKG